MRQIRSLVVIVAAVLAPIATTAAARADDELPPLPSAPTAPAAPAAPEAAPPATVQPVVPLGYVPDTVFLTSGGLVRGSVVESAPGDHVTLAMPTGEIRRIPWAAVDHLEIGAQRTTDPAAVPAPQPLPDTPKRGPLVRVHITSEQTILLDRRPQGAETWVPACTSPCDEELPLGDTYRLSGAGVRATSEFRLQGAEGGHVDLKVDAATKRAWWVGAGIGGLGLVLDGYGLYLALVGSLVANQSCSGLYSGNAHSCDSSRATGSTIRGVGLVMLIPGTAAAIIGGAMMVKNWRTGLSQSNERESAQDQAPQARPLDAFKRTAELRASDPIPAAPTLWMPLASGTF